MFVFQDFYHKMIELSSEARIAYEVMLLNLEQTTAEEIKTSSDDAQPEEPEYSKYDTLADIHKLHPDCYILKNSNFEFCFFSSENMEQNF